MKRLFSWLKKKPDPIRVGIVTSRTGPLKVYGITATQGLELGIEYATGGSTQVAGRPIKLLIEDDAGDPEIGAAKARQLIEEKGVDILAGCASSNVAIKVTRVAEEQQRVLLIDPAATDVLTGEWLNRYVFRTAPNVSQDAAAGGKVAVEHLGQTFCFLSPDYIFGHQSRSAWWRVIEEHGGAIVGDVLTPPDATDYTVYLQQVLDLGAEVLVAVGAGSAVHALFSQIHQMGIPAVMRVSSNLVDRETVRGLGRSAPHMVGPARYHYAFADTPINDWLVRQHQRRYGAPPDLFTGTGFATGIALVEGLKRTDGDPDPEVLIPVLEGMRFEGPKGTYTFRPEDHQALQPMYVMELVRAPEAAYSTPRLIETISAAESAPPLAPEPPS